MDQITNTGPVGVKTHRMRCADCKKEVDRNAADCGACAGTKKEPIPPDHFGRVVEMSDDGKSGYVDLVLTDEQRKELARQLRIPPNHPRAQAHIDAATKRRFFHVDELHSADEMRALLPAEKMRDVERLTALPEPSTTD